MSGGITATQVMLGLSVAGTAMSIAGTIAQGNAAKAQGLAQQQALAFKAKQQKVQAGQEKAASQRNAYARRKESEITASRGLAVAAASGGGAFDPTVVNLLGDVEGEGEYKALNELYIGNQRAHNLESGADLNMYEGNMAVAAGNAAQKSSRISAIGQGLSAIGSIGMSANDAGMFDKTSANQPKTILSGRNYATPSMYSSYG